MRLILILMLLALSAPAKAEVCTSIIIDPARGNREIPIRVRLPDKGTSVPAVVFSHGLGGSLDAGSAWAAAWAASGIATISLQHRGSDVSLTRGLTGIQAVKALRAGATPAQYLARVADVRFLLDQMFASNHLGACSIERIDTNRLGIAGHSFGAQTTQALAGQTLKAGAGTFSLKDTRFRAAVALSPSPAANVEDAVAFGSVDMPFMSVTGSRDEVSFLNGVTAADRQRPFTAMPSGSKYLLILDGADHFVLAGGEMPRSRTANDNQVERIVARTTSGFWERYLGSSPSDTPLARPTLRPRDVWQFK